MEGPTPVAAASASLASAAEDVVQEKTLLVMKFPPVAEAGGKEDEEADDSGGSAEEDKYPVEEMSLCGKIFRTIFVYASYFAVALSLGILGPLLTNLEVMTGSTTSEVSAVFTFRGVLAIIGSLLLGPMLDVVNRYLIVGIALVMDFFLYAAVPWCKSLYLLYVVLAPPEFFNCIIGMGTHLLCIGIWGDDSRSSLQLLNLIAVLGFMTAPLLAKPFLMTQAHHTGSNNSSPTLIRLEVNARPEAVTSGELMTYRNLVTSEKPMTSEEAMTSVYVFVLVAVYSLVVGIVMLAIYLADCGRAGPVKGTRQQTVPEEAPKGNVITKAEPTGGKVFVAKISVLYFVFNFFYGGIEIGYAGLVSTFAVKYLGWSTDDGSEVTAVVQGANAAFTAVAVVLSRYIKPQTFVTSNVLAVILSLSLLCLVVERSSVWLWVCTAMLGASYASIMPSSISWVSSFMVVDGKFSSAYWAGFFTGFMVIPGLTGHLFNAYHAMWFPYCMLLSAVAMGAIYVVLCAAVHFGVKPKNNTPDPPADRLI